MEPWWHCLSQVFCPSRCCKRLFAEPPVLAIGRTNIWNWVNYWDRSVLQDTLWFSNQETFLGRADARKRQLLYESAPWTTKMGDFNFSYDSLCGQLLNTHGQGGRTPPSLHRLFFCSHFSPPLLKLWCFSGMEECNEMMPKEMIHFLSPLIAREVITVNEKWCSSIAKRQISAGAITVRWIDVLFTPPDGEAMGANDLYKEENPEYHKKSLSLALHWGITLCIKAWTRL